MRKIGSELDVPLVSNQLHGGRTPILSQDKLREIGYRMAIYPTAGLLAAAYALNNVYGSLVDDKPVQAPLYDFNEFSSLIGFQEVWDFEKKYASLEADRAATWPITRKIRRKSMTAPRSRCTGRPQFSVAIQFLIGRTTSFLPRGPLRVDIWSVHVLFGFALASVVVLGMLWRATRGRRLPPLNRGVLHLTAVAAHRLLQSRRC